MAGSKVLPRSSLGPMATVHFQNVRNVPLAVQFYFWGHENEGRLSSGCDGRSDHNKGWILASTHSPAFHGCIPAPNTVVLIVDALLNVKFLFVREHREHFEGAPWTFQQDSAPSHGSRMTQRWIQDHIPAFISKEDWPSSLPCWWTTGTWLLWTFRCNPSSRARPAEVLMNLSRIWRPNCSGNGPWFSKKFCVPRTMPFKGDWSKLYSK